MPIIAITCLSNNKIIALTCSCTEEEYQKYKEMDIINEYTISGNFLKEYLGEKGFSLYKDDLEKFLKKSSVVIPIETIVFWTSTSVITIPDLKNVLDIFKVDFREFIDAYCENLKSL